ncbi:MAG: hypothetical protein R6V19_10295 [Armatimonadota bacterium]
MASEEMGSVRLEPSEPVVAGSRGTWRIIYTVGSRGIAPGGGVKVTPPNQGKTIWDVGHVYAYTTREGVACEVELEDCYPQTFHWRRVPTIYASTIGGALEEGEEIVVVIGERGGYVSGYERRAKAQTIAIPHTWWGVWVDTEGNGAYITGQGVGCGEVKPGDGYQALQEVPQIDVIGGEADCFSSVVKQPVKDGAPCRITVCARDSYGNRSQDYTGTAETFPDINMDDPAFDEADDGSVELAVPEGLPEGQQITVVDRGRELVGTSNPVCPGFTEDYNIYFGDLHVMCGWDVPWQHMGSDPAHSYEYAREVEGLDFACVTMQPIDGSEDAWREDLAIDEQYNRPHEFVTFPAIEFYFLTGHKNVYFPDPDPPLLHGDTPEELYESIGDTECLVNPHHPNCHSESVPVGGWSAYDIDSINPQYERLVEVCQNRGSFEVDETGGQVYLGENGSSVQDILASGLRMGFVGGTDTHMGLAGEHRSALGGLDPEEVVMGGFTAILAPELTREALYEALKQRRCYATLASHILLDVRLNGHLMGSELTEAEVPDDRELSINVAGMRELEFVEIVRNNETVAHFDCNGLMFEATWNDDQPLQEVPKLKDPDTVFYYVRVQQSDRRMAWSSPIWVEQS